MARWDTVVVGGGIGGLTAAAALARAGQRVLVLEREAQVDGSAHVVERDGFRLGDAAFRFGGFGPGQLNQRLFDALIGERLKMVPIAGACDRVSFPGFTIDFDAAASYRPALEAAFPKERPDIARYADALEHADGALVALFAAHCAPTLVGSALAFVRRRAIEQWVGRTTREVVHECVRDARLRSVLCARWSDCGSRSSESAFVMHATLVRHYLDGAWFPVGGAAAFARELVATVRAAGGSVRTGAEVAAIGVDAARAAGVTLADGERVQAQRVVSGVGIHGTWRLLAASAGGDRWADDALALRRSVGLVALHVGLEGDIAALGAAPATHWFYESWDVDAVWRAPFDRPAPAWSVSFPSLRDPAHRAGRARCHTCEILALVDASDPDPGAARRAPGARRAATWRNNAKRALLAQLLERFPRLADCVRVAEVVLPGAAATGPGATGGLPVTPQRFLSPALRPRTPIAGLYLAGQDVGTPGVIGAAIGGVMAAVTIEPAAWKWAH